VQEIEKLNAECLEFEETVVSLRKEIADAWGSYKVAQEKAAVREEELLDEIQEITKAKATDKQQMQLQLAKASEEVTESLKLLKVAQADKDSALAQLQEYQQEAETWKAREESLLTELAQARAGSVLGAQDLLESLANAEKSMHQMRSEHSSLLRQSQVRQHELERNIAEISNSLMEKDKELMRFQMQLQQAGRDEASQRDLESLRSQVSTLLNQLDEKSDKHTTLERRTKALESELRANLLSFQDERERAKEIMSSLEAKIVTLEDNLKEATKKKTVRPVPIGLRTPGQQSEVSDAGSTGDWEVVGEDPNALAKALDQIQQLTVGNAPDPAPASEYDDDDELDVDDDFVSECNSNDSARYKVGGVGRIHHRLMMAAGTSPRSLRESEDVGENTFLGGEVNNSNTDVTFCAHMVLRSRFSASHTHL
jgi:multidrug efflux pump subunit AcrA (membrane-fusion protein)